MSKYLIGLLLIAACSAESKPAASAADAVADVAADTTAQTAGAPDAAADAAPNGDAAADAATPAAPFGVGVLEIEVKGANGRILPTTVWYPIAAGTKGDTYVYLGMLTSPLGAIEKAPAAKGPFPLVAFSHGNQGIRQQSVFLTEELARHGYVVVAPDHVGNTFLDYDAKLLMAISIFRPLDITASIDRVLQPTALDPAWLKELIDADKIAVTGHSFGGYTTLAVAGVPVDVPAKYVPDCSLPTAHTETCQALKLAGPLPWVLGDKRVKLIVPLAHCGQLETFGFVLPKMADLKVPAIFQASTADTLCEYKVQALPAYAAWGGPKALVSMQGGNHFTYSDLCLLPISAGPSFAQYCKDRSPALDVAHKSIVDFSLAACDAYLKGDTAAKKAFAAGNYGVVAVQSQGIAP